MARNKEFNPSERLVNARNVFWEKGYYATSMDLLVKGMKINRASIYATYGDKHTLYLSSLYDYANATFKEYKNAIYENQSPLDSIKKVVDKAIERTFDENKACLLVKSSFEVAPHDKELNTILQILNNNLVSIFKELITEAQKKGEINKLKEPNILAQFTASAFAGFWQNYILYNDKEQVKQLASVLFTIFD